MKNRIAFATFATIALAGCATLGLNTFREPVVHFNDAKLRGLGLSGGSVDVVLSVYNPNRLDLNATRLTYRLMGADKELGTGALNNAGRGGDNDSTYVTLAGAVRRAGRGTAARQRRAAASIHYRGL